MCSSGVAVYEKLGRLSGIARLITLENLQMRPNPKNFLLTLQHHDDVVADAKD